MAVSVVSILPAGKHTSEHTVPLSADGQEPATHYAYHGWEPSAPVAKTDETVQARTESFTKREVLKQPLEETEKTGRSAFLQAIAVLGLQRIIPPDPDLDPKADAQPVDVKG